MPTARPFGSRGPSRSRAKRSCRGATARVPRQARGRRETSRGRGNGANFANSIRRCCTASGSGMTRMAAFGSPTSARNGARRQRPEPLGHHPATTSAGAGDGDVGGSGATGDGRVYAKVNCLHCNHPACVSACIVGALRKQESGAVTYDAWKCIGCRYCMVACPFQIPAYEYDDALTPQVRKCKFCSSASAARRPAACVKACPRQTLRYGKRWELLDLARQRIARPSRAVRRSRLRRARGRRHVVAVYLARAL